MILFQISNLNSPITKRRGFTLLEIGVSLVILATAMILVVQVGYWSFRERARTASQFVAVEQAANVLEAARAVPWDSLTTEWAESQQISAALSDQLPDGKLMVTVEPVQAQPLTKRVTVEVRWMMAEEIESRTVRLIAVFSRRAASKEGDAK